MRVVIKMTPSYEECRGQSKESEATRHRHSSTQSKSPQPHRQRRAKSRSSSHSKSTEGYQRSHSRTRSRTRPKSRFSSSSHPSSTIKECAGFSSTSSSASPSAPSSSSSSSSSVSAEHRNCRMIRCSRSRPNAHHSGKDTRSGKQCHTVAVELDKVQRPKEPRHHREQKKRSHAPKYNPDSELYMVTEVDKTGSSREKRGTRSTTHKHRS